MGEIMLPILVSLGPVKIYSYGVMMAIGLFLSLYFWWKMGRDEHFDEIALFDGFFLSVITYLISGRAGYVVLHTDAVGTVYRSLAILAYPGINTVIGLVGVVIFMILFARSQNWDEWKVVDAMVVSLTMALLFGSIGAVLNGTNPIWQVNAYGAIWAFITFLVVSRVRKNFRFYAWYKAGSSMAQEGLATLIFLMAIGIYYVGVSFLDQLNWKISIIPGETIVGVVIMAISGYLISRRVGRRENTLWGKLSNIIRRK